MKVGRLTVGEKINRNGVNFHKCICECGTEKEIRKTDLTRSGVRQIRSCGCLSKDNTRERFTKHGLSSTRFYRVWANILKRIDDPKSTSYKNYGGRGIKVCPEWRKFENFKNDMYESYLKHVDQHGEKETSIERINFDGDYHKNNCKWATRIQQNNNQRRHKKFKATNIQTGESFVHTSKSIFSREHGITRQHISKVLNGERSHTGGFKFEYLE